MYAGLQIASAPCSAGIASQDGNGFSSGVSTLDSLAAALGSSATLSPVFRSSWKLPLHLLTHLHSRRLIRTASDSTAVVLRILSATLAGRPVSAQAMHLGYQRRHPHTSLRCTSRTLLRGAMHEFGLNIVADTATRTA